MSVSFLKADVPVVELEIAGAPKGKDRPRMGRGGRVYTPKATKLAESIIIDAWVAAGSPRCPDGVALRIDVALEAKRPDAHFRKDGTLSAEGLRHPRPRRAPDIDNALKLVMDALNKRAYRDDVDIVDARVTRSWGAWESTSIRVYAL